MLGCIEKMVVCVAHGTCLSRRASWLFFGTLSLPQPGGREGAREHAFQQLGLADTATEDEYSEMEYEEVQDFPDICAEMLSADAGRFVRDEDILPLEARSALPAVQCACERHPIVRIPGIGCVVDQGFLVLAVIRSICGIAYRANCHWFSDGFRWSLVTAIVNHVFTMLRMTLHMFAQSFANSNLCRHLLRTPHRPALLSVHHRVIT